MKNKNIEINLAIIGLGYVGLPLVLEFAKKRKVIGFDTNHLRVEQLNDGIDKNLEFTKDELKQNHLLKFTNNQNDINASNYFIVTVPTPVNKFNKPDLKALKRATRMIGDILKKKRYSDLRVNRLSWVYRRAMCSYFREAF